MALFGVYRGVVVDAAKAGNNRVVVQVPQASSGTMSALVCHTGARTTLRMGATVIVAFEGGNVSYPVVLGQID